MDPDRIRAYLDYIIQESDVVRRALEGVDRAAFEADPILRRAMERAVETIGEAVGRVRPVLETRAPDLPWRQVVGMRNILAHVYWDIDTEIVWEVITVHLPDLRRRIAELREQL